MKIEFEVTKATVLSLDGPDHVLLDLAKPVHGDLEPWNDSSLRVQTARGNGTRCLRQLGWQGEFEIVTKSGSRTLKM